MSENESLRICLVGPAYPYRGGISHYNSCLARELKKRHKVHIVNYSRLYPEFLFPGKTQYDESDDPLTVDSKRIIDSINPLTWFRAALNISRFDPDIVLVQWWHPYFAPALFKICALLRMLRRVKILFICHNVVPHERSTVDRALTRLAFLPASAFIVQSKEDRDNLLKIKGKADVIVHPHPIYDFFREGKLNRTEARRALGTDAKNIILFFGYIRPYKGLKYLLEAMKPVAERIEATLYVVGEFYEDSSPYRSYVEEEGLSENVIFIDRYVDNEEVEMYFAASDLVVLPYISATQSGIAQIALAFDRPMIVTRVGGLPEVVVEGSTGFIVPAGDSGAISKTITRFFEESLAEAMEKNFEEEKKRFTWEAMVAALERFVETI